MLSDLVAPDNPTHIEHYFSNSKSSCAVQRSKRNSKRLKLESVCGITTLHFHWFQNSSELFVRVHVEKSISVSLCVFFFFRRHANEGLPIHNHHLAKTFFHRDQKLRCDSSHWTLATMEDSMVEPFIKNGVLCLGRRFLVPLKQILRAQLIPRLFFFYGDPWLA